LKHPSSILSNHFTTQGFGEKRIDSIPHAVSVALLEHLQRTGRIDDEKTPEDALLEFT
jgi:hypothetical protein